MTEGFSVVPCHLPLLPFRVGQVVGGGGPVKRRAPAVGLGTVCFLGVAPLPCALG